MPSKFSRVVSALAIAALSSQDALACTRVLWGDNGFATYVGRTMDWPGTTEPLLAVLPRGMKRDGGRAGPEEVVKDNPLRWTSKYGSIVTTIYGLGTADGLNEKGLGAHMLYLNAADFGQRDAMKPGLQVALWAQYVLDNAATVSEALALLEKVQLVMIKSHGFEARVHLAVEDASGDSAVIEVVGGKSVVHHGRDYKIMTNDPPYDELLAKAKTYDISKPSSAMPLPGNVNPVDRFVRATYYLNMLPKPKTTREAAASMFSIARNVSVPFGAPYGGFGIYNTEYRTVLDLTNKAYFFEFTTSPNVVWAELGKFNLSAGAPVRVLDPNSVNLSGDVSKQFKTAKAAF